MKREDERGAEEEHHGHQRCPALGGARSEDRADDHPDEAGHRKDASSESPCKVMSRSGSLENEKIALVAAERALDQ